MNQIEQRDTESQILLLENMCSAIFSVFSFFFVRYLNKRSFMIACDSYYAEFYAEIFLFFQFNAVISLKLVYFLELFVQLFANFLFFLFSDFPVFYYNFAFVFKWAFGTCIIWTIFSSKIAQMCIQYQTKKTIRCTQKIWLR